jgi:hypothetical protein
MAQLATCRNNRPVRAPGLQMLIFPGQSCRPGALTRRLLELFKGLLGGKIRPRWPEIIFQPACEFR